MLKRPFIASRSHLRLLLLALLLLVISIGGIIGCGENEGNGEKTIVTPMTNGDRPTDVDGEDSEPEEVAPPQPINPPPPPANGVELHFAPFEIPPGEEREVFFATALPANADLFVNKIEIRMAEGSHRFILFEVTGDEPVLRRHRDLDPRVALVAFFNRTPITVAQVSHTVYEFPDGVGIRFHANAAYDMSLHYVNKSDEIMIGEAFVTLHTVEQDEVKKFAKPLYDLNAIGKIRILPEKEQKVKAEWKLPKDEFGKAPELVNVFMLTSHTNRHGKCFRIFGPGGGVIYDNVNWEDPEVKSFNPPIVVREGEGLLYECTFVNDDLDRVIRFGFDHFRDTCKIIPLCSETSYHRMKER